MRGEEAIIPKISSVLSGKGYFVVHGCAEFKQLVFVCFEDLGHLPGRHSNCLFIGMILNKEHKGINGAKCQMIQLAHF